MSEFSFFSYTDFQFGINETDNLFNLPIKPYYATERSNTYTSSNDKDEATLELNVPYTVFEILVAIFAVIGNLMVIIVFQRERRLRRRTNYYIISLAIADFLVGLLGVPFAILASIGLPRNLYACLFTVSLLVVLCTISIFCLVAVSVDRYWAILYPMAYNRNVRAKTAIIIISFCWVAGTVVGFLPLFGWHANVAENQQCFFTEVMDYDYLVFLYFATIITPALLMFAFYVHIYQVIIKQVRQIVTMNPIGDCSRRSSTAQIHPPRGICHNGTMLRVLGPSRKREVKAAQNLSIIVFFFMMCWIPLYTINCIKAFCATCEIPPKLTLFCIILSHLNSAGNPVLYAYHLKDFRDALKNLIFKMMCIDMEPPLDTTHRYSLASQHRLQSIDAAMRNNLQPRIYVDSPIWLRQQQQQAMKQSQLMAKCVTPCLNNINQTVAAVASATTDIERNMWNIMEVSNGGELVTTEINYEFPDVMTHPSQTSIDSAVPSPSIPPTPPPRQKRSSQRLTSDNSESPTFSYENCNYSNSPNDDCDDFEEVFLPPRNNLQANLNSTVDPKQLQQSLLKCKILEKLRSDESDYQNKIHAQQRMLTDASFSDVDLTKNAHSDCCTPSYTQQPNIVYVIDDCRRVLSPPPCKRHFKKSNRLPKNLVKSTTNLSRSCSCTSDSPTGTPPPPPPERMIATIEKLSSNCSSNSLNAVIIADNSCQKNCNNNLHTINNLNYYTIPSTGHQCPKHSYKFSPMKAVSKIRIPPIVKHSSLFQLFQPSGGGVCGGGGSCTAVNEPKSTTPLTLNSPKLAAIKPFMGATTENEKTDQLISDPIQTPPPLITQVDT